MKFSDMVNKQRMKKSSVCSECGEEKDDITMIGGIKPVCSDCLEIADRRIYDENARMFGETIFVGGRYEFHMERGNGTSYFSDGGQLDGVYVDSPISNDWSLGEYKWSIHIDNEMYYSDTMDGLVAHLKEYIGDDDGNENIQFSEEDLRIMAEEDLSFFGDDDRSKKIWIENIKRYGNPVFIGDVKFYMEWGNGCTCYFPLDNYSEYGDMSLDSPYDSLCYGKYGEKWVLCNRFGEIYLSDTLEGLEEALAQSKISKGGEYLFDEMVSRFGEYVMVGDMKLVATHSWNDDEAYPIGYTDGGDMSMADVFILPRFDIDGFNGRFFVGNDNPAVSEEINGTMMDAIRRLEESMGYDEYGDIKYDNVEKPMLEEMTSKYGSTIQLGNLVFQATAIDLGVVGYECVLRGSYILLYPPNDEEGYNRWQIYVNDEGATLGETLDVAEVRAFIIEQIPDETEHMAEDWGDGWDSMWESRRR